MEKLYRDAKIFELCKLLRATIGRNADTRRRGNVADPAPHCLASPSFHLPRLVSSLWLLCLLSQHACTVSLAMVVRSVYRVYSSYAV